MSSLLTAFFWPGYQRQMKYRHNDYSYSAWGENEYGNATGSLWLTAFVIKSMGQSSSYIDIDMDDIKASAEWIKSRQLETGCFPQVGRVFSSYLKGGYDGENPAGLTAFVLIAFIEANLGEEVCVLDSMFVSYVTKQNLKGVTGDGIWLAGLLVGSCHKGWAATYFQRLLCF